jgi:hypothetical protein
VLRGRGRQLANGALSARKWCQCESRELTIQSSLVGRPSQQNRAGPSFSRRVSRGPESEPATSPFPSLCGQHGKCQFAWKFRNSSPVATTWRFVASRACHAWCRALWLRRTDSNVTRETKLAICRHLVQHANQQENHERQATVAFLRASLERAIEQSSFDNMGSCQILLEAGMDPNPRWVWDCAIRQENNEAVCLLLVQFGADPLAEQEHVVFLAAARKSDRTSLFEYFLQVWDERFADNGGKNHHSGNYPIHVVCCAARVSLPAIQIFVHRHADALAVVDQKHGLYPFQLAAKYNASLDVIFCLLHHCPDAWSSSSSARNASTTAAALLPAADETTNTNSAARGDTSSTGVTLRNNSASGPVRKKSQKGKVAID